MLTEDYCDFETAKLLKEKTFNGLCNAYYDCFTTDNFHSGYEPTDFNSIDTKIRNIVSAPTLQMAMKWLREVHNCNIEIDTIGQKFLDTLSWRSVIYNIEDDMECYCEDNFKSYEQACEAAIKYCLEHLI